jgi:hypothetical protein
MRTDLAQTRDTLTYLLSSEHLTYPPPLLRDALTYPPPLL